MEWHFTGDAPIYTQLVDRIKQKIVSGEYIPGQRFPAVRDLAQEAGVNPNTMQRAMQELERQGLLFSQRTSGRFVTDEIEKIEATKREMVQAQIEQLIQQMDALGCGKAELLQLLEERLRGGNELGDSGVQGIM